MILMIFLLVNNMSNSQFGDYFTNPNFVGGYNAIKEGKKEAFKKGMVYVEDDSDISLWKKFINQILPNKYNFTTATSSKGNKAEGKRVLEKMYPKANIKVLFAVDADYDFLTSNLDSSHAFRDNPFILHTYSFSKESVMLEKTQLDNFIQKCQHTQSHNADLEKFLVLFSEVAFDGLIKYLAFIKQHNFQIIEYNEFHQCFNIKSKIIVTDDLSLDNSVIHEVVVNLSQFFSKKSLFEKDIQHIMSLFNSLNITEENAYRFISGHEVYDLVEKVHKQLIDKLYNQELLSIRANFQGEAIKERIAQLKKHFDDNFKLPTFCNAYVPDEKDEIHQKILQQVFKIKELQATS